MSWYCEYCGTEQGQQCPFRDKELTEGAILTTNGGQAGAWYIDDEIDTRPTATFGWKEVRAYACKKPDDECCPVSGEKGMTDEEFEREQKAWLEQRRKEAAERLEEDKKRCAERTVTYDGVTYQNSFELEVLRINGSEEEYLEALKHAPVISREQPR